MKVWNMVLDALYLLYLLLALLVILAIPTRLVIILVNIFEDCFPSIKGRRTLFYGSLAFIIIVVFSCLNYNPNSQAEAEKRIKQIEAENLASLKLEAEWKARQLETIEKALNEQKPSQGKYDVGL